MSNEADKSASFVQTLNIRESDEGQPGVASLVWPAFGTARYGSVHVVALCMLWLCACCGSVHVVALCTLWPCAC